MGSRSDWETMRHTSKTLDALGIDYDVRVVSAHRTPDLLYEYAETAIERGLKVIIAGAGGAAHLPGMTAAKTRLPVIGVPVESKALSGRDGGDRPRRCRQRRAAGHVYPCDTRCRRRKRPRPLPQAADRARTRRPGPAGLSAAIRIGVVGGGQLGQMLGEAAAELGMTCTFVDPSECGEVIKRPFDDEEALAELAATCDVITYEFENVPVEALERLDASTPLYPPPAALARAQDRKLEKALFVELGIPVPAHRAVDSRDALAAAVDELGLPIAATTRRSGYDGKGQFVIREDGEIGRAWEALAPSPLIVEAWVPFDYEVSIIGARSTNGEVVTWPLSRNTHRDGILRVAKADAADGPLHAMASDYVGRLLEHLDYVGVLTLELFVAGDRLLANEFAPRVHNSGHWTIEGSETSQFANHLKAIAGEPLGSTGTIAWPGMVNLIGRIPDAARSLDDPRLFLHDYGKEPREGRKLGHITCVADSAEDREALLNRLDGL